MAARRKASSGVRAQPYVRHRPGRTLLYQLVEEHYPALKAHLAAQGTEVPGYNEPRSKRHQDTKSGQYACFLRALANCG